ncbi:TPA: polyamine ABC transporter substrate-binding protein, partial [Neisseria gonorrhoeae]
MQAARPSLQCFLFLNERSKTMKKTLVAAILSLALTACGGGSDTAAQTPS